ncbi:MAG: hypothetical protein R3Y27_02490 [Clostridia bacterium]
MKQFYLIMSIIFTVFTIVSIFFVFTSDAQLNAGYSVIPMLITLSFSSAYRHQQRKEANIKAEQEKDADKVDDTNE